MPIYEYKCMKCGHILEELQSISEPPLTKCPECGSDTLKKMIGSGAGLVFKGTGFYITDYKNKSTSHVAADKKRDDKKTDDKKTDVKKTDDKSTKNKTTNNKN